jgi:O-antigen/teichoic acid export membrane protein
MRFQQLVRNSFIRDIFTVASGTVAAQAITICAIPFITRLYGPEAFGVLGTFMSFSSILAAVAALALPHAIVLPRDDAVSFRLAQLSLYIGIIFTAIVTLVLSLLGPELLAVIDLEVIAKYIYLIPIFIMITVLNLVVSQWMARMQAFKLLSKVVVGQAIFVSILKIMLGAICPLAIILIISNILAMLVQVASLLLGFRERLKVTLDESTKNVSPKLLTVLKDYRDFPRFRTPQILLFVLSNSFPVLILATFYGSAAVGFYSLAYSVLSIPANLIGTSVSQVFYPKISKRFQKGEPILELLTTTTFGMAVLGIGPCLLVVVLGPYLFEAVFGAEWEKAGVYAQWFAAWLFLGYLIKPAVAVISVLRLQKGLLFYEVISTFIKLGTLTYGYYLYESDVAVIALFSMSGVIAYVCLMTWVVLSVKKHDRSRIGDGNETSR